MCLIIPVSPGRGVHALDGADPALERRHLLFAIASPRLVRRLGDVGLACGGGALMCAAWLMVASAATWQRAAAGVFVAGIGFYMMHSTLQVHATDGAGATRPRPLSAFASSFFLGQSVGVASPAR
jgi:hypothetical protein